MGESIVAKLAPNKTEAATAFGLFNFVVGIMALPASALCGGLWYYINPATAFLTGGALALLAAAMLPWALRTRA